MPLNSSAYNQPLRVGRFLLVWDAPDKDDTRYWAPDSRPSDPPEQQTGDEETRDHLSHNNFDYDCFSDYPRGRSENLWGVRRGNHPPLLPIEQARSRLGFLTIQPDWIVTPPKTPKKKATTPAKKVTPAKRKATNDDPDAEEDEDDTNNDNEDDHASASSTKRGAAEATYTALSVEVKGAAIRHGFDLKKNIRSRNTQGFFEFMIDVIETSKRLHPPIRRVLLRGAYDEAMVPKTVIEDGKPTITQEHTKTLRTLSKQKWDQERRWLWHAWETVVTGFVKNLRSTVARESEQVEALLVQQPYYRGDDDTLPHPALRDPILLVLPDTAEQIRAELASTLGFRRSNRHKQG